MSHTISVRDLVTSYGDLIAVDHLTLDVSEGEIFGLLGPNGAGKTTTILMLLGMVEPTSGSISILGMDPRRNPLQVKRKVGYVPDAVGFYDSMTGRQNLRFTARLNAIEDAESAIDEVLRQVGLVSAADKPTRTYSRGMKQRLGLADALLKKPSVLILDEPTTAIDPEGIVELLDLIHRLAKEEGVSVLLASHLLHQVQAICDQVAIFVDGKVVAKGTPYELARVDSGSKVRVEVRIEPGQADPREELRKVAGEPTPGRTPDAWVIEVEAGGIGAAVRDLVNEGANVIGIRRLDEDLEAIYHRYFEQREEIPA